MENLAETGARRFDAGGIYLDRQRRPVTGRASVPLLTAFPATPRRTTVMAIDRSLLRSCLVTALLFASTVLAEAADPVKLAGPTGQNAAAPLRKLSFEMRDKPWNSVLEWLADQTGLHLISNTTPTGTFTFINGGNRQYTVPEIIDILNEELLAQKLVLIRHDSWFTILTANEKVPAELLPRIELAQLDERGNSEVAQVVVPLTSLVAEDFQPEVKRLMGPLGEAVALARANQLVLTDSVGNLKRIYQLIKDYEGREGKAESFAHTCLYVKARDAEKILRELLGDPKELLRAAQPANSPAGFGGDGEGGAPQSGGRQRGAAVIKVRMHYISSDERTNTVLVTGPADKTALARELLKRIDVAQPGQPPIIVGPPTLKTYSVATGNAEALAKTLQEIYKNSSTIRITHAGANTILVWAPPEDQIEIAKQIIGSTDVDTRTEKIALTTLDAAETVDRLRGMFGDMKSGAPYFEADVATNSLIVRGSPEQIIHVKGVLQALGESGGASGNLRVISIRGGGSAAAVAEALRRMLPQLRPNPVNVIMPSGNEPPAPANKHTGSSDAPGGPEEEEPPAASPTPAQPTAPKREEHTQPLVTITPLGNRLIVASDDPQALALAQEIVRMLTQSPGGDGDFEIIRLKNASAAEAAKVLDEAFNGTKQAVAQPMPAGFGRFGAAMAQAPITPAENRIRVVADPTTNSLLVRASPLDLLTIRRLLEKAIDRGQTDSLAVSRTWIVGPFRFATANDIAGVVRDVYREHMSTNSSVATLPGFGFPGVPLVSSAAPAKPVTLSLGVDDRSNTLILNCSSALHDDIKKLADNLDATAKKAQRSIQVVQLKFVDPLLVQQAVDAIQGRRRTNQNGETGNGGVIPAQMGAAGAVLIPENGTGPRGGARSGGAGRPPARD